MNFGPVQTLLSERLASVVPATFFRPLARPSAPVYIDCADRLAQSADEGGQISDSDTQALIREVLAAHPQVQLADDEGEALTDLRQRAGQLFNKLLEAGWVQERHVSLDERWVLLAAFLARLVPTLPARAVQGLSLASESVHSKVLASALVVAPRRRPDEPQPAEHKGASDRDTNIFTIKFHHSSSMYT
jgi:hypothetical protein